MDFPEDIYSARILEVVAQMPEMDLLEAYHGRAVRHSKLCGSRVEVTLCLDEAGHISAYGQKVEACLLGQTSAAVMARTAIGLGIGDVREVRAKMAAMLKEDGPPPGGIWQDLEVLHAVRDFKPRHASMLLVFDAVIEAFEQAAAHLGIVLELAPVEAE